jgi:hypothetical protein
VTRASDRVPIGVVLERRQIDNPWADHVWRVVAVIPGAPPVGGEWRLMVEGEGWTRYHAATLDLEIHSSETDGYRANLNSAEPKIFVVLRPNLEAGGQEIKVFLVTACPYEAGRYTDVGDDVMEGVPMPDEIAAWLQDFIDKYHVEMKFVKRQRLPYDPRKVRFGGRGPRKDGDE